MITFQIIAIVSILFLCYCIAVDKPTKEDKFIGNRFGAGQRSAESKERIRVAKIGNKNGAGKRSPEFSIMTSKAMIGNTNGKANKGKKRSAESVERIRAASKGRVYNQTKGVVVAFKNGVEIGQYKSAAEAARQTNSYIQNVSKVINGYLQHTNRLYFKRIT
jgi:hypothetical protein